MDAKRTQVLVLQYLQESGNSLAATAFCSDTGLPAQAPVSIPAGSLRCILDAEADRETAQAKAVSTARRVAGTAAVPPPAASLRTRALTRGLSLTVRAAARAERAARARMCVGPRGRAASLALTTHVRHASAMSAGRGRHRCR